MKVAFPRALLVCFILAFSSNCTRTPPKRSIRRFEFQGHLFALDFRNFKLYEVTPSAAGFGIESRVLSEHVLSAAVSPNGKYLVYFFDPPSDPKVKDNKVVLRDLTSGQEKQIMANVDAQLLSWAPDSQKFSYEADNAIHVADLQGNSRVAYQAPSGQYKLVAADNSTVGGGKLFVPLSQPRWIAPNRFVLDRYVGDLPSVTGLKWNQLDVEPNTATIISLEKGSRLIDLPKRWIVRDFCPEQSLILLGETQRRGQLYLTTATDLVSGQPRPLPPDVNTTGPEYGPEVRFMPHSCRLIYPKDAGDRSKQTPVVYIDPATLQETSGPTWELGDITSWVFDPEGKSAAVIHKDNLAWLSIVNVESGKSESMSGYVLGLPPPTGVDDWRLLGWTR